MRSASIEYKYTTKGRVKPGSGKQCILLEIFSRIIVQPGLHRPHRVYTFPQGRYTRCSPQRSIQWYTHLLQAQGGQVLQKLARRFTALFGMMQ